MSEYPEDFGEGDEDEEDFPPPESYGKENGRHVEEFLDEEDEENEAYESGNETEALTYVTSSTKVADDEEQQDKYPRRNDDVPKDQSSSNIPSKKGTEDDRGSKDKQKEEEDKRKADKEIEDFFEKIGFDKNRPFTEKELEEYERDLEHANDTPNKRIMFVPAKRFSNFNFHYVLNTYVPFTVDLSRMSLLTLDGLEFLYFVSYINASENLLTESGLEHLEAVEDLIALVLESNKMTVLKLPRLESLTFLDLGKNEIAHVTADFVQPNLESLILNYNRLEDVSKLGRDNLPKLRFLSAKRNSIVELEVDWPRNLTYLYLGENEIADPRGLAGLVNLRVLHLRHNRIRSLKDFPKDLLSLEYLNLRSNLIRDALEARRLVGLPKLRSLSVKDNPCTFGGESEGNYRLVVLSALPRLEKLDKRRVTREERERARQMNIIFGDDRDPGRWPFAAFGFNEDGEAEVEIEVESPDFTEPTTSAKDQPSVDLAK